MFQMTNQLGSGKCKKRAFNCFQQLSDPILPSITFGVRKLKYCRKQRSKTSVAPKAKSGCVCTSDQGKEGRVLGGENKDGKDYFVKHLLTISFITLFISSLATIHFITCVGQKLTVSPANLRPAIPCNLFLSSTIKDGVIFIIFSWESSLERQYIV
jgi:hypothetical protein